MSASCSHHCRSCDGHFSSLRAFDSHLTGPMSDRRCELPDELVGLTGVCAVCDYDEETAKPIRREGVVVYQLEGAGAVREWFSTARAQDGTESAPAAQVQRKSGVTEQ